MRIVFLGDIVGRPGRDVVIGELPALKKALAADFVIANGENAAAGFGITGKICDQLFEAGVDVITGGNHSWDQREILGYIGGEPRLLRPVNYPPSTPGRGIGLFTVPGGRKVLVVNVMGQLFMEDLNDPFAAIQDVLSKHRLGQTADAIVVDFHGEATSEKMAGRPLRGRPGLALRRDPYPCPDRRCHDSAGRHRLSERCRHVRRLRFGDRHGQGNLDRTIRAQGPR